VAELAQFVDGGGGSSVWCGVMGGCMCTRVSCVYGVVFSYYRCSGDGICDSEC
jgi:hypothetical protein